MILCFSFVLYVKNYNQRTAKSKHKNISFAVTTAESDTLYSLNDVDRLKSYEII